MGLKKSFITALILSIIAVVTWECYWRYQGLKPNIDDNKNLWANQRAKLENFDSNTVVFIGSSRILYDIQLDIWKEGTKTDPVMLAVQGASPVPVFKDIVEKTDYNGLLIVGVTPGLFFSTLFPEASPIRRPQTLVDYYYKRTYAQKLNHKLSVPLQKNLAFYRDGDESWDTDVDLKTLISQIKLEERSEPFYPPFNNFEDITLDRHMKMPQRLITDTAYANTVKKAWKFILSGDFPPPEREAVTNAFVELAEKFKKKGGELILVRCPSSGLFKEVESKGFSRDIFWNELVTKTGAKSYNYMDYEQFSDLHLPEWSHLSAEDAQFFTKELIKIMKADGISFNSKTN